MKAVTDYGIQHKVFKNEGHVDVCIDRVIEEIHLLKNILCANDMIAMLLMQRIKAAGLELRNFNIAGFSNLRLGEFFKPSLTTVVSDHVNSGSLAVDIYTFILKKGHVQKTSVTVDSKIIIRESTNLRMKKCEPPKEFVSDKVMINFYEDEAVRHIEKLESMISNCDATDLSILKKLLNNTTYEKMAEMNLVAVDTIKYRIKKMQSNLGVRNRNEMIDYIRKFDLNLNVANEKN
jgi:hypothetical protein